MQSADGEWDFKKAQEHLDGVQKQRASTKWGPGPKVLPEGSDLEHLSKAQTQRT